jgi:hypothetical protein
MRDVHKVGSYGDFFSNMSQDFAGTNEHYWQDIIFLVTTMVSAVQSIFNLVLKIIWA